MSTGAAGAEPSVRRRKPVSTIALIGPDGAGKTAVARALIDSCPLPIKYLYMGTSIESSNYALPTSRLVHHLKIHAHKRALKKAGKVVPQNVTLHGVEHRMKQRGKLAAVARLIVRMAEEAYRQFVSWTFQIRGFTVLYDRHFLFDVCPPPSSIPAHRLTDRIHCCFLRRILPRPGLVIFLDAPPDVLYARKQELPKDYLRSNLEALREKRVYAESFVRVDAAQRFDEVLTNVRNLVMQYSKGGTL